MTYSSRLRKTLGITASLAMLFQTFAPVWTYAQSAVTDYDLVMQKTIVSQDVDSVVYRLSYNEASGDAVTDVTLSDQFGEGLIFSGVVDSLPDVSLPGVSHYQDSVTSNLVREGFDLPANTTGYIDLEFEALPGTEYLNTGVITACNADAACLADQGTYEVSGSSIIQTEATPVIPEVGYDVGIEQVVGNCDGWTSGLLSSGSCSNTSTSGYVQGDDVYYTLRYYNEGSTPIDNVVISDEYFVGLEFDSLVRNDSTSSVQVSEYMNFSNTVTNLEKHNQLSFTDGFTLAPGEEGIIVLKFNLAGGIYAGSLDNFAKIGFAEYPGYLGTSFHYDAPFSATLHPSYVNDGNVANNDTANGLSTQISTTPFDLNVSKSILSAGSRGGDITYRISIENTGFARNDIAVMDMFIAPGPAEIVDIQTTNIGNIGRGPGMEGHFYGEDYLTEPGANNLLYNKTCDDANNCKQDLRWGNIELDAGQTGFIDVTIKLPEDEYCGGQDYDFVNSARVSITDNTGGIPTFLPIYDPTGLEDYYINLLVDTDESDVSNNSSADTLVLTSTGTGSCGGNLAGVHYAFDLDLEVIPSKTDVCPGEEIDLTYRINHTGDDGIHSKYIQIMDEFTPDSMEVVEVVRDSDRYACLYETPAFMRALTKQYDLFRAEKLAPTHYFSYNETYDLDHYINTVPACERMYDSSSTQYAEYMDAYELISNAYADYMQSQHDMYVAAGLRGDDIYTNVEVDAENRLLANADTLLVDFDSSIVSEDISTCYQAQFYDRILFDHGAAPSEAATLSSQRAGDLTNECLNLGAFSDSTYTPCLGLAAHGNFFFGYFGAGYENGIISKYKSVECPIVDLWTEHNDFPENYIGTRCADENDADWPVCERAAVGAYFYNGSEPQMWFDIVASRIDAYATSLDATLVGSKFKDLLSFNNPLSKSQKEEVIRTSYGVPIVGMNRGGYYDYIADPNTNCDIVDVGIFSNNLRSTVCDLPASLGGGYDDLCNTYSKTYRCESPNTGGQGLPIAGIQPFDVIDSESEVVVDTNAGFRLGSVIGSSGTSVDMTELYFSPPHTITDFTVKMKISDTVSAGDVISNTGYIGMCDGGATYAVNDCLLPENLLTHFESGTGVNNIDTDVFTVKSACPTCDISSTVLQEPTSASNVGDQLNYQVQYCNDGGSDRDDITLNFEYLKNRSFDTISGDVPSVSFIHDTDDRKLSRDQISLTAGECKIVVLDFTAVSSNVQDAQAEYKVTAGYDAATGEKSTCAEVINIHKTSKESLPAQAETPTGSKTIVTQGPYNAGDEIVYELSAKNIYADGANLELWDDFDAAHLSFVSATVAPDFVDGISGQLYWDLGLTNNGEISSIEVTFEVLADVIPGTQIQNNSKHLFTTSPCPCGNDTNPDDNTDFVPKPPSEIQGYIYHDVDDNDMYLSGTDAGLPNVALYLNGTDNFGNAISLTGTTNSDGSYSFPDLLAGVYEVQYDPNSVLYISDSAQVGTIDSIESGESSSSTVLQNIVLDYDQISENNNFGLIELGSLVGQIYYDADGSDTSNVGDTGLVGQTVILQGRDIQGNDVLLTTLTDSTGNYIFTDLVPSGKSPYIVSYSNTNNTYTPDSAQAGASGTVSSNQQISEITLNQGEDLTDYNFGLDEVDVAGTVAGYVYADEDMSASFTTGDEGLAGVQVTLTNEADAAITYMATTDAAGAYLVTDVVPGDYTISYDTGTVGNYNPDSSQAGTGGGDNTLSTELGTVSLANNQSITANNFGLTYVDVTTEISCAPTTVTPGATSTCTVTYGNEGTADANAVSVTPTVPTGWTATAPSTPVPTVLTAGQTGSFTFEVTSPVDASTVGMQYPVDVDISTKRDQVDVYPDKDTQQLTIVGFDTANVAGTVYVDEDNSASHTSGDLALDGVEVTLQGEDVYGNTVTMTQLTDLGGDYNFTNLTPGDYTVTYDTSTTGVYMPDSAQSDDGSITSNILIEKLEIPKIKAQPLENNDFGLTSLDLETTIDCTPNPVVAGTDVTCTVNYANLSGVEANKVDVTTTIPATLTNVTGTTSENPGTVAAGGTGSFSFTATVDPSFTGSTIDVNSAISAAESEANMTNNAAIDTLYISAPTDTMTLSGSVKTAAGDPIVAQNVVITGVEPDGTLVNMTVPTNSNGEYAFAGLVPGAYEVSYTPATGYTPTSSAAGSEGGDDTDTSHTVISKIVLELDDKPSKYDFVVDYVDLQVSINCTPQYPNPGTDVVCTINYSNIGGLDATGVNLTGTFPIGYTTTDTLPTGLTVAAGTSGSATMTFSIPDDVAVVGVTENFKTTISADQTETDTDNNTATDEVRPEIASNNPPVANNDSSTTAINTTLTGTTLFVNDNDPDGDTISLDATNSDTTSTNGGTVVINTDGTYTYTPATDFTGTDTFMYTICDDATPALCDEATVLVEVTATAPIANNDFVEVAENEVATIDVLANDTPYTAGDVLTITPSSVVASTGTVIINTDGELEITPPTDYVGTITVVYEICDEDNECSTATVVVNVDEIVPNEPVAVNDMYTTTEDTAMTVNIAANDTDPDNNLDLTTISLISQPANGTVVVGTGGEVTYTPNAEFAGVDTFVYEVCDDSDPVLCDVAVVEMTVEAVNDAPVATNESVSTNEDTAVTIDVQSNDTDIENDTLTTTQITADPASGTVSINTDGTVMYTPAADFTGTDTFEYEICDDGTPVMCDTAEVSITVDPVNDTPMAMDDSETTVEDMPVTIDVLANDDDVDGTLTVTQIMTQPANGTVVINTDGTLTYTPNADYNNTAADLDVFTYEVCDDSNPSECDTASVDMMVTPDAESDVSVTVTCTPENALGGEEVVCVVSYENTGNDAAEDVEITLEYPSWMEITELPTVAGTTCRFGSVICGGTGWTVGAGESGSYEVVGTIAADAGSQIGEVSVSATTSTDETTMTNNTAMDAVTAYVPVVTSRGGGRSPSGTTSTNTGTTDIVIAEPEPVEEVIVSEPEIEFTDEEEKIIEKIEEIKKEEEKRKNPTPLELGNVERGNEGRSHFVAPSYLPATGANV